MRAAIFIDGGYFLSQMKKHDINPKYEELTDYFLKPLRKSVPIDLLRCYFYYCAPWMSPEPTGNEIKRMEEHEIFMEEIRNLTRSAIRLGKLQRRWDGNREYFEQKRVDVLLSVDMVRHSAAGHIQHVIVVAGDSDFIPAVEATKESGATVTIWYGDDNTIHNDLLSLADITHQFVWKKIPGKKVKKTSIRPWKSKIIKTKEPEQKQLKPQNRTKPASKKYLDSKKKRITGEKGSRYKKH